MGLFKRPQAGLRRPEFHSRMPKPLNALKAPQELRTTGKDRRFKATYSACTGISTYHDLTCGHRCQVPYISEDCGWNCLKRGHAVPFVCGDCIVADVRLEMLFEGIDIASGDNDEMADGRPTREEKIRGIADKEIKNKLDWGLRVCKIRNKFQDPQLQFLDQFMREDGFGGVDVAEQDTVLPKGTGETGRRFGLAQHAPVPKKDNPKVWEARYAVDMPDMDGDDCKGAIKDEDSNLNNQDAAMDDDRPGLEVADDATKAVREAFEFLAVNTTAPKRKTAIKAATPSKRFRFRPNARH
jgi:hypothetical protein